MQSGRFELQYAAPLCNGGGGFVPRKAVHETLGFEILQQFCCLILFMFLAVLINDFVYGWRSLTLFVVFSPLSSLSPPPGSSVFFRPVKSVKGSFLGG